MMRSTVQTEEATLTTTLYIVLFEKLVVTGAAFPLRRLRRFCQLPSKRDNFLPGLCQDAGLLQ